VYPEFTKIKTFIYAGRLQIPAQSHLKEGVLVPDTYEPALNPLYRDVLAHYGAVALPCRIKDPDRRSEQDLA
jgi:hypothetical protein